MVDFLRAPNQDLLDMWSKSTQRSTWADVVRNADTDDHRAVAANAYSELAEHSPIDGLRANAELASRLDHGRWHIMRDARENGHTWAEIGDALGITRQAAQQTYTKACESQVALLAKSYGPTDTDMQRYRNVLNEN